MDATTDPFAMTVPPRAQVDCSSNENVALFWDE